MFTTLSVINMSRESLKERLYLVRRRRFISHRHQFENTEFYTTGLYTYCEENKKSIHKFSVRSGLPVLTEESPLVTDYKYMITANTVLKEKSFKSIGIYDADGRLSFLPEFLAQKSGHIMIFTRKFENYSGVSEQILQDYGTPISFVNKAAAIKSADIVFSFGALPFSFPRAIFGDSERLVKTLKIENALFNIPDYCNPLIAAAGLYFICKKDEFSRLCGEF